ncbi:hypothetical protein HK405_014424 [Cladochytrium tenue]|nr:hypothetical protein HK405_014424 [Cladochytrium tenue]
MRACSSQRTPFAAGADAFRVVLLTLALAVTGAAADSTSTIDATSNYGTWEGWGVSLAWWAAAFGTRTDLADVFFTTKTTTLGSQSLPGLGFTVARYNAGACSWNSYQGSSMVVSPDMIASRQMHGFWLDWASTDTTSSSWNWTADANQVAMMRAAVARGVNKLELFSNSPMWWMCVNHNPSGSNDGSSDNLQSWNYQQHAVYLASVAAYAAKNWGVSFTSVEPFNEPSADWWNGQTGTQEGCHFDVATQAAVIPYMRSELDSRGLTGVIVSASDENTYDEAKATFASLGSTAVAKLGRVNVHGYQYGSGSRDGLYAEVAAAGLALWNSEYGEDDATGAELASNLILDLIWLHPTAWVYWQALDGSGWGLVDGDNDAKTVGAASQKYFVLALFTRHILPGMRILGGGSDNVVAAYDATAHRLAIVAVNWGSAQYINFDLSGFSTPGTSGALVRRWSTLIGTTGAGDQYVARNDTYLSGSKFWSYFATNMAMAFEVDNVVL